MGKKILIVDDEYYLTRSLSFMLQKEGFDCEVAHDGQVALEKIESEKPDLIFLDVNMPKKDGYEVAREICNNPLWKGIYIIMLSSRGQQDDKKIGLEARANEYFLKPFGPKTILEKVKEILGDS